MLLRLLCIGKHAGAFNHHLHAHGFPRNGRRVSLRKNFYRFVAEHDRIAGHLDVLLQVAENGIVFKEMGQRRRVRQVIDGDKLNIGIVNCRAQDIASNTTEAVNSYFNCHCVRTLLPIT